MCTTDDEICRLRNMFCKIKYIVFKMKILTKLKSYNGKTNTNFDNNNIPTEGSQFICLSLILIDPVFRTGKNYYSQVFVEECKYVVKEKKIPKYIIDNYIVFLKKENKKSVIIVKYSH